MQSWVKSMPTKAFFVYGFPKNERDNLNEAEEQAFKEMAKVYLPLPDEEIAKLIMAGIYAEVNCDG